LASGLYSDRIDFEWQDQTPLGLCEDSVGATEIGAWSNSVCARLAEFISRPGHFALTSSLVRHVWARHVAGVE
jgi:hypothetical protein